MRGVCHHCRRRLVTRPRGLCFACYYEPAVRVLYPSTSKFARRGVGITVRLATAPEPTTARPGTPEKVDVLARRAAAGEFLFHPKDAQRPREDDT